jgi:hypothetical protein
MTKSSTKSVPISADELHAEFVKNGWQKRLDDCRDQRVDETQTFEDGEREYHTRIVSRHYENGIQIAISVTKMFHAGNSNTVYRMLLIGGTPRHIP